MDKKLEGKNRSVFYVRPVGVAIWLYMLGIVKCQWDQFLCTPINMQLDDGILVQFSTNSKLLFRFLV